MGIMIVLMVVMIVFLGWQWYRNRQQERLLTEQAEEWAAKFQQEQAEQRQQLTLVHDSMGVILAEKERVMVKKGTGRTETPAGKGGYQQRVSCDRQSQ